ncbi:MAG: hypothetical protein ACXWC9_03660 [Pseudobdellovibrionaceae bacterium]
MKSNLLRLIGPGLLLMMLFQNCSKIAVEEVESKVSALNGPEVPNDDDEAPADPTVPPPTDLMKSCDTAKATGRTSIAKKTVSFSNAGESCAWNQNGNLSMVDREVRARIEKYQIVELPAGATICDIQMEHTAVRDFRYDDNIIMTLNDYILTSTTTFSQHFVKTNGYYKYDWTRLVGKPGQVDASDTTPDKQYCAGKADGISSCLFPLTQQQGQIDLQIGERVIQNILAITTPYKLKLGVITTGDNDDSSDCQHTPIQLSVDVEYFR